MTVPVAVVEIAASVVMTGVPLVVAMLVAAVARALVVDVLPPVAHAVRVMIVARAASADRIAEMVDSTDAMIARRVTASRLRLLCKA